MHSKLAGEEQIDWMDSGAPGPSVCIAFGVHGNERAPIEAGARLVDALRTGEIELRAGGLLLVLGNPLAGAQNQRWSEGGVDLNRCFHADVLAREPKLYEERRAREIAAALSRHQVEILVDFHCTVEPGERFLMQHPGLGHEKSRAVWKLLRAGTLLTDPKLHFGGVSLDEWMSTRGGVGICYETGWIGSADNTPESVLEEMQNLLCGLGLAAGSSETFTRKDLLELDGSIVCAKEGFRWREGIGQNLQKLRRGTALGSYADGQSVALSQDAVLIFPKKRPELVQIGKPLVLLASQLDAHGARRLGGQELAE
jgi:predicted deacylase